MKTNIMKEILAVAIIILLVGNFSLFFFFTTVYEVYALEKYDYYGYVPAKMWRYNLTDTDNLNSGWRSAGWNTTAGLVAVVGIVNGTHVKVYSVDNGSLVSEATINSMQKHYTVFRNGTSFRVETDKLASVYLLNYASVPAGNATTGPLPDSFYQSTSGTYVGKEFILLGSGTGYTIGYAIFALENAEVTVTRNDSEQRQYSIPVNTRKEIMWQPFRTYKIVSTGYIMIQSGRPVDIWGDARSFFLPSVEGGFVGNAFYSWSQPSWDITETYGFRASAAQDAKITVFDLETKQQIFTANIPAGNVVSFKPSANAIVVQSDKPITLQYLHDGSITNSKYSTGPGIYGAYGSGVSYLGVKPNEDTTFYLSVDSYVEAYIFASEDTEVTVDGQLRTIRANSYYLITEPGTHIINSNKKVVVETLNWPNTPENQGLTYNGVQIPSVQTVDVVVDLTLTPLGESFPMMYVVIGAAAAAICIIVAFIFMRGRGKK